jgi:hypothetical protein
METFSLLQLARSRSVIPSARGEKEISSCTTVSEADSMEVETNPTPLPRRCALDRLDDRDFYLIGLERRDPNLAS